MKRHPMLMDYKTNINTPFPQNYLQIQHIPYQNLSYFFLVEINKLIIKLMEI